MILGTFNNWNIVSVPNFGFMQMEPGIHDIVSISTSPFTSQTQIYDWNQSILSLHVSLPPLTQAQANAWVAFLMEMRGPANVCAIGDPLQTSPLGVAGVNLVPDATFSYPIGVNWSQPDSNWFILNNALCVGQADSGLNLSSSSQPITVTPGYVYVLSGTINAVESLDPNGLSIQITNPTGSVIYASTGPVTGLTTNTYSVAFTVPSGATSVVARCNLGNASIGNGYISFSTLLLSAGYPCVNGAGQSGYSLITNGWAPSTNNVLLPGDYITLNSAPNAPRLYRVTSPVNSDSGGNATISIYPPIRETPNGIFLSTPTAPTGTVSTTGGTLAAGTYTVSIAALNQYGSTVPSPSTSFTTTGSTSSIALSWTAITNAVSYNVWLSTGQFFNTTATTFTLTTATGTTGQIPTANTTGNPLILQNTSGLFRLADQTQKWSIGENRLYNIAFQLAEAL